MATAGKLLDGKWCLITGAGRGIGAAIAEAFAAESANLVLVARTTAQLEEVAAMCRSKGSPQVDVIAADLTDSAVIDDIAKQVLEKYKAVHVLVNNAGVGNFENTLTGDPDEWDRMLAINLKAPMRLTRRLAPAMVEQQAGTIINIGSIAGIEPMSELAAYAATKHGLRGWSLSCHDSLRKHNIKVVLINPGAVDTPMARAAPFPNANFDRMIRASDVAEAAMLALRTSPTCVPQEMTLRPVLPVY